MSDPRRVFCYRYRALLPWLMPLQVLLALIALGFGMNAVSLLSPQDPLNRTACDSCHMAGSNVTGENAELLFSSQEQLCVRCHEGALQASHPSGLAPSMTVPSQFPLDWKGDLTCSSCHRIHADSANAHGALRVAMTGKAFCTACHAESFFLQMADTGTSITGVGHLDAQVQTDQSLQLDLYSARCMSCHEAEGEAAMYALQVDAGGVARHQSGTNHPIGGSYQQASDYGGYKPEQRLPESMLLPDGNLACVSCHLGYSQEHGALVTAITGSNLCYQCHDI